MWTGTRRTTVNSIESPDRYDALTDQDKKEMATLSEDMCIIRHAEETDKFIRAVLHQKVSGKLLEGKTERGVKIT
jgi:hypothetical protein